MTSPKERIDELMTAEVDGMRPGIFGREWCEACGREASFTGFVGAMAAHSAHGRFVCWACRQGRVGNGSGFARADFLDGLILGRGFRYCAGCGREVALSAATLDEARRRPFTCERCEVPDIGVAGRRRYLEHEVRKPGGLERAEARVRWAKTGLGERTAYEDE